MEVHDTAQIIQSFLDTKSYIASRLVCRACYGKMDDKRIYNYKSGKLPKWVKKIKLGDKINCDDLNGHIQLTYLDLNQNKNIRTTTVKKLQNLTHLFIGSSLISEKALVPLKRLRHLHLGERLRVKNSIIPSLVNLVELDLGSNQFYLAYDNVKSTDIAKLVNLEILNLNSCKHLDGSFLENLTKLKRFDSKSSYIIIEEVKHLSLEYLRLSEYKFSVNEFGPIHIPTLKELHLYSSRRETCAVTSNKKLKVFHANNSRFGA